MNHRYPHDAAALAMPAGARVADDILTRAVRRQSAWRLFVAFTVAKAKEGDREAAELIALVDSGGAA